MRIGFASDERPIFGLEQLSVNDKPLVKHTYIAEEAALVETSLTRFVTQQR